MALGTLQTTGDLKRWLLATFPSLSQVPTGAPRIVRGIVNTTGSGSITVGAGFSITRNGVGDVTITFDADFHRPPAVTVSKIGSGVANLSGLPSASTQQVIVRDTAFAAADGTFEFVAVENDA